MVRFYCPGCWSDFTVDLKICPVCGARIEDINAGRSLTDKLLNALGHPDRATVMRAIWILGQRCEEEAVGPLIELAQESDDVYMLEAIVISLGLIGNSQAIEFLKKMKDHPAKIVREAVEEIMGRK